MLDPDPDPDSMNPDPKYCQPGGLGFASLPIHDIPYLRDSCRLPGLTSRLRDMNFSSRSYLWGHPQQIFWSEKAPSNTREKIFSLFTEFKYSST
jgi:hypothetical protein